MSASQAHIEEVLEPELVICDPHHHLWDLNGSRYLLSEFAADIGQGHRIESTVFVECTAFYSDEGPANLRYVGETAAIAELGNQADSGRYGPSRIAAGIVGRVDLNDVSTVEQALDAHLRAGQGRFKGVRHCAAWDPAPSIRRSHTDPPPNLYRSVAFQQGFAKLEPAGLSFDAWLYHPQIPDLTALARAFPDTPIMLDHVGGPLGIGPYAGRRDEVFAQWAGDIGELARCENVWVKLGGLGMTVCGFSFPKEEPRASSERLADAWRPYVDTCIEAFGAGRAMFESNFPMDKVSCSYTVLWNAFKRLAAGASAEEKAALFHDNAQAFYRL